MTRHRLAVFCAALVCPILYLVFVTHFWVNEPNLDDWNALWLVSQSVSGHLTLSMLWAQHNENRMLVPNLVFVVAGRASHGNEQVVMALSAALFIVTYFAFLGLCRSYLGRLSWRVTLVVGAVWFSVVDYGNALTAFQLAWYLVIASFVGMLWLLMGHWRYRVPAALALAVLASFSSLQGLLLWPIGLLCLRWKKAPVAPWIAVAAATTVTYFIGYSSNPINAGNLIPRTAFGENVSSLTLNFPFIHFGTTVSLSAAELGIAFPAFRQLAGAVILLAGGYVATRSVQRRELLPITLIGFAALFDALILLGRLRFGYGAVTASRYSMPGLVMLLAILLYAWKHVRTRQAVVVCLAVLAIQIGVSSDYGISQAAQLRDTFLTAQRLAVADPPPSAERYCYAITGLYDYELPNLSPSFKATLRDQRLSVFTRKAGPAPSIPQCKHGRSK